MMQSEGFGERDEEGFFRAVKEAAEEIMKRDDFVVVFHYDADGCSAGAIALKALEREGKKCKWLCLKQLYKENIDEIKALGKNYIFVDFGSGQLDYLKQGLGEDFFIFDHHQPVMHEIKALDGQSIARKHIDHRHHVNPLLFGINGGTEISGAGVAYFFAEALNKKTRTLRRLPSSAHAATCRNQAASSPE